MSIDDERDLAGRLDQAFAAITPPPAPLAGAIRQGKAIRLRRRLAGVADLAVATAAAVAVAVPLLHAATSPPAGPQHPRHTVTVLPPGPHPAAGLIAAGTIDGRRWRITVSPPGTGGAPRDGLCVLALSMSSCGPASGASPSAPVDFGSMSDPYRQAQYGPVGRDVSYVTVRLGDGTVLTLRPVTVYGVRYVGFAAPTAMTIRSATAYSARGVLATAIPFDPPGGAATFSLWLHRASRARPGPRT